MNPPLFWFLFGALCGATGLMLAIRLTPESRSGGTTACRHAGKAILEFELPEAADEFRAAQEGLAWREIVTGLVQELRLKRKHGHEYKTADEVLDSLWTDLHRELDELRLSVED